MHLASDQGSCCSQQTVCPRLFAFRPDHSPRIISSYVQELEARLMHMESLFTQITPVLEQLGPLADGAPVSSAIPLGSVSSDQIVPAVPAALLSLASRGQQQSSEPSTPNTIKAEEDVAESFGDLALDEYGHMRWIGGSSIMSLIQSFKALASSPLHRISPMDEDPHAPGPSVNKLYFPAAVFFGKIRALPCPEEVEYPQRDLADKLVSVPFSPTSANANHRIISGGSIFREISLLDACDRQAFLFTEIPKTHG